MYFELNENLDENLIFFRIHKINQLKKYQKIDVNKRTELKHSHQKKE